MAIIDFKLSIGVCSNRIYNIESDSIFAHERANEEAPLHVIIDPEADFFPNEQEFMRLLGFVRQNEADLAANVIGL
jgi:hypothetical protein